MSLHLSAMRGTVQSPARCVALNGVVGKTVSCGIYVNRPNCCRKFTASFDNGIHEARCDQARRQKGLPALMAGDFLEL